MKESKLQRGDRVRFTLYGEEHTGRVLRLSNLVWIADDKGGPLFRERWMHPESVHKINEERETP